MGEETDERKKKGSEPKANASGGTKPGDGPKSRNTSGGGRSGNGNKRQHNGSGNSEGSGGTLVSPNPKLEEEEEPVARAKRKPGQKHTTPTPGQADRVFYETLLVQRPDSHMAQDWCLAYGVCPWQDAHDLYIKVCKRKGLKPTAHTPPGTVGSPAKKLRKSGAGGGKGRQAKEDMDGDTGFDPANAYEGVGTMGL